MTQHLDNRALFEPPLFDKLRRLLSPKKPREIWKVTTRYAEGKAWGAPFVEYVSSKGPPPMPELGQVYADRGLLISVEAERISP
jgi:hypothetical protein